MKRRLGRAHKKLDSARQNVEKELKKHGIKYRLDGRVKSVYSLHKKLRKTSSRDGTEDIAAIYDLIALRIIVADKDTCYQVLGIIHSLYKPMVNRIKDYIAMPKQNGYQSLHTTVITPEQHIVEFQIRTEQMHDYAERGLAASFHYNEQKLSDAYHKGQIAAMPADLYWIRNLQKVAAKLQAGKEVNFEKLKVNLFSDRIFVYTPKGDIFDLPVGSLPLDFAYRVHSDVGARASSFRVNGRMVGFDEPLKTGDMIEVITRRNISPKLGWLGRIVTPHARNKIRAQLRKAKIPVPRRENLQKKKG
jgi:GTP pyrophosphokinase